MNIIYQHILIYNIHNSFEISENIIFITFIIAMISIKKKRQFMSENIKINISGIKSHSINTLLNKYTDNLKITLDRQNNTLQLHIQKGIDENFIFNTLDTFINNFNETKQIKLSPSWFFDQDNSCIQSPKERFPLTHRELVFLKMLLKNGRIITYTEMFAILWKDRENVSRNAMRVFIKNIKKKLPPNFLINSQDIGYKLILD